MIMFDIKHLFPYVCGWKLICTNVQLTLLNDWQAPGFNFTLVQLHCWVLYHINIHCITGNINAALTSYKLRNSITKTKSFFLKKKEYIVWHAQVHQTCNSCGCQTLAPSNALDQPYQSLTSCIIATVNHVNISLNFNRTWFWLL